MEHQDRGRSLNKNKEEECCATPVFETNEEYSSSSHMPHSIFQSLYKNNDESSPRTKFSFESKENQTSNISPEKTFQDLYQWFGNMATDFVNKINVSAVENFDTLGKDLKNLYNKMENMIIEGQETVKMSAKELKQKTIDELYQVIKVNVICNRDKCKCVHQTTCTSPSILDEVKRRLVDEGFDVNYVINENSTHITLEW